MCDTVEDQIVGLAVRLSDGNTVFGGPSAHGLMIACAPVTIEVSGKATVGTEYTKEVVGDGGEGWAPSTLSGITRCQPGWVVSGMTVHKGTGQNRFIDVTMRCSQIGYSGLPVMTETIDVMGSGSEQSGSGTVDCMANEVIARMPNQSGSGVDSVNLFCSPTTCL